MSVAVTLPASPAPAPTSPSPLAGTGADDARAAQIPIEFARGLVGLPDQRSFLLSRAAVPGTYWLESADHHGLAFLLVDPFPFFDGFAVDLDAEQLSAVLADDPADVALFAIVTLPTEPGGVYTANLQAPLAINLRLGRARQLVLPGSDFGVRCPIPWNLAA